MSGTSILVIFGIVTSTKKGNYKNSVLKEIFGVK